MRLDRVPVVPFFALPGRVILCVVALLVLCSESSNAAEVPDIFEKESPAVVLVTAWNSVGKLSQLGSGFIVMSDGVIVTNHHVIEEASRIILKLPSGKVLRDVVVLFQDEDRDLAVLFAGGQGFPVVRLGDSDKVRVGEEVMAIGNQEGFQNTLTTGVVSGRRRITGKEYIQTTAPLSKGSSGAPLFNMEGEVIGMAVVVVPRGQNLNFAIPINDVRRTLQQATAELESEPELERESWYVDAFDFR